MENYSEKEIKLFNFFGFGYLTDTVSITALPIYRILIEHAFRENMQGPEVESLRRIARAFDDCKPYRLTKEFDDLITFS